MDLSDQQPAVSTTGTVTITNNTHAGKSLYPHLTVSRRVAERIRLKSKKEKGSHE